MFTSINKESENIITESNFQSFDWQTNDELNQTTERCDKVTGKSVEAHVKADQERQTVKGDLDNVRKELNSIRWVSEEFVFVMHIL